MLQRDVRVELRGGQRAAEQRSGGAAEWRSCGVVERRSRGAAEEPSDGGEVHIRQWCASAHVSQAPTATSPACTRLQLACSSCGAMGSGECDGAAELCSTRLNSTFSSTHLLTLPGMLCASSLWVSVGVIRRIAA